MGDGHDYDPGRTFPSFWPLFDPGPSGPGPYLALLDLGDGGLDALRLVHSCCEASPDLHAELRALLSPRGWRENLVGAAAVLTSPPLARPLDQLWRRIGEANQVAPQLAAVASLVDSDFSTLAAAQLLELTSNHDTAEAVELGALIEAAAPLAEPGRADAPAPGSATRGTPIGVRWRSEVLLALSAAGITLL